MDTVSPTRSQTSDQSARDEQACEPPFHLSKSPAAARTSFRKRRCPNETDQQSASSNFEVDHEEKRDSASQSPKNTGSPSPATAKKGGRPVTWIGGGGLDSKRLSSLGVPQLRALFLDVFGQHTASNNAAWLRRKLSEPPDAMLGRGRSALVRARDIGAAIWTTGSIRNITKAEEDLKKGVTSGDSQHPTKYQESESSSDGHSSQTGSQISHPFTVDFLVEQLTSSHASGCGSQKRPARRSEVARLMQGQGAVNEGGARRKRCKVRRVLHPSTINEGLLGQQVEVYWPDDGSWWAATLVHLNVEAREIRVVYKNRQSETINGKDFEEILANGHLATSWMGEEEGGEEAGVDEQECVMVKLEGQAFALQQDMEQWQEQREVKEERGEHGKGGAEEAEAAEHRRAGAGAGSPGVKEEEDTGCEPNNARTSTWTVTVGEPGPRALCEDEEGGLAQLGGDQEEWEGYEDSALMSWEEGDMPEDWMASLNGAAGPSTLDTLDPGGGMDAAVDSNDADDAKFSDEMDASTLRALLRVSDQDQDQLAMHPPAQQANDCADVEQQEEQAEEGGSANAADDAGMSTVNYFAADDSQEAMLPAATIPHTAPVWAVGESMGETALVQEQLQPQQQLVEPVEQFLQRMDSSAESQSTGQQWSGLDVAAAQAASAPALYGAQAGMLQQQQQMPQTSAGYMMPPVCSSGWNQQPATSQSWPSAQFSAAPQQQQQQQVQMPMGSRPQDGSAPAVWMQVAAMHQAAAAANAWPQPALLQQAAAANWQQQMLIACQHQALQQMRCWPQQNAVLLQQQQAAAARGAAQQAAAFQQQQQQQQQQQWKTDPLCLAAWQMANANNVAAAAAAYIRTQNTTAQQDAGTPTGESAGQSKAQQV